MERRLTAILAADVVGYSRLMGEDEVGTLARLKTCRRELVDPAIEEFHGRIVKLMGDGALVEFASVVDAVQCAAAIQRRTAGHDQGAPEAQRIQFRLGVNLGDVIVDGNDIYGDGVNVAARLRDWPSPEVFASSGTAFDHVVHKADVGLRVSESSGSRTSPTLFEFIAFCSIPRMPEKGWSVILAGYARVDPGGNRGTADRLSRLRV
jgi:hypothetical protein